MMLRTKAFDGANVFMSRNLVPPEIFDALLDALKQNGAQVFLCCDPSRNGPNDFHLISSPQHEKFEELRAKGCNLLGPQCVLSCGKENRALPKRGFTCCLAMDGTKVLASGFDINEKAKIEKLVTAMGGMLQTKTSLDISFVVMKNVLAAKYKWALNNLKKPIVTVNWLYQCWNEHRVVPQEPFKVLPFSGLTISVTRLKADERKEIEQIIIQNGGKYSPELTKHCTHLISDAPEGDKYKVALRWGHIHIVTRRWFDQSIARKACLNEESYPVQGGSVSSSKTVRSSSIAQHSQEKCIGRSLSISSSVVTESNLTAFPCAGVSDSDLEATLSQNMSSMFSDPSAFIKEEDKAVPVLQTTNEKNFDCPVANDSESEEDYLYLSECRISLVGFEASELRKLVNMIRNGGGSRYMSFNDKLTHIIIGKPSEIEKKGLRTLAASGVIHVVRTTWLEDCDREKKEVPVLRQHIAYDLLLPKESLSSIKGAGAGISGLNHGKNSNVHHSVTSDNLARIKETGNRMLSSLKRDKEEEPFVSTDGATAGISGLNHSKNSNVNHSATPDNLAETKETGNRMLSSLERNKEVEPLISTHGSILRETMAARSQQNLSSVVNHLKKDKGMQSDPGVRNSESNTVFKGKTFCFLKSFPEHNRAEIVEWINQGGGMVVDEHVKQNVDFTIDCHGMVPCAANIPQSNCVSSHWIRSSLEAGCLQDVGSHIIYSPLRCRIPLPGFERFRFYASQYDDKDKLLLRNLCVVLGAKFMGRLTKNATHLLCKFASGSKYEAACKWGISPIRSEWIYECVNQNQIVPVDQFRPKEVTCEDLEAGVCTVSQFPTQSFQISDGSSPQVATKSQDLRNTTHAHEVDGTRNEVQESRDTCKKARFSEIDVQEGMVSSRLKLNHSNNAKRTGGNSSKGDGETSHGVSDVAAAIEDFLDLTSNILDQESTATADCDRNLYSSNCSILGDDRGASHAVTRLSKPCHRTGKSDELSNPSKDLRRVVDGFSETQTESQVVGYEEDLSGRQMLIDRVRTRSSLV